MYRFCPDLKHVLFEVFLLFLAVPEPLENQLTEVWEVDETFPRNTRTDWITVSQCQYSLTWQYCLEYPQPPVQLGSGPTSSLLGASPTIQK